MDQLSVVAVVGVLCGLLLLRVPASQARRRTLLLAGILGLFGGGELLLLWGDVVAGALLFGGGAALFLLRETRCQAAPEKENAFPRLPAPYLLLLVAAVLAVGAGLRFWRIGDVPYGIEHDEMSWTVAAAHVTYTDLDVYQSGVQRHFVPVSSVQERVFFDLCGMSIEAARLEVAFFSTVAVALFYLFVRHITNDFIALIATFFLAISTLHISAARQANVESHILFWVVLTYLLFWLAVKHRSVLLFFGTGISVVLGLWTYDTYNMTAAVVAAALAVFTVTDLQRWRFHALGAAALLLPIVPVAETEFTYIDRRHPDHFRKFDALRESLHGPIWEQVWDWLSYFGGNLRGLLENLFQRQTNADFLLVRPEWPLVLAGVLPLAALGLLLVLRAPARAGHLFVLLWLALQLLFVPVVLGTALARVLLPGSLAVFVLAGVGAWHVLRHLLDGEGGGRRVVVVGATLLVGALLVGVGANMYFSEIRDPADRRMAREWVDLVAAQRDTSAHIVIPYTPGEDDYLYRRRDQMRFAVGKPPDLKAAEARYDYVPFGELLPEVSRFGSGPEASGPVLILLERRVQEERPSARSSVEALRHCCRAETVNRGTYFELLRISEEALPGSCCPTTSYRE